MSQCVRGSVLAALFAVMLLHTGCSGQTNGEYQNVNAGQGRTGQADASSDASGDIWSRFRGPGGQGMSDATGLPLEWDAKTNVAWQTALPGPGASSPITYGDRTFLSAASNRRLRDTWQEQTA